MVGCYYSPVLPRKMEILCSFCVLISPNELQNCYGGMLKKMSCESEKLWREVKQREKASTADMTKLMISAALINILKMYSPNYDLHVLQLTIIESKTCFKVCPKTWFKACPKTCMFVEYSRDKNFQHLYYCVAENCYSPLPLSNKYLWLKLQSSVQTAIILV